MRVRVCLLQDWIICISFWFSLVKGPCARKYNLSGMLSWMNSRCKWQTNSLSHNQKETSILCYPQHQVLPSIDFGAAEDANRTPLQVTTCLASSFKKHRKVNHHKDLQKQTCAMFLCNVSWDIHCEWFCTRHACLAAWNALMWQLFVVRIGFYSTRPGMGKHTLANAITYAACLYQ